MLSQNIECCLEAIKRHKQVLKDHYSTYPNNRKVQWKSYQEKDHSFVQTLTCKLFFRFLRMIFLHPKILTDFHLQYLRMEMRCDFHFSKIICSFLMPPQKLNLIFTS